MSDTQPLKSHIVCIDSDGCAMDTMNVKHEDYFGPLAADVYGIQNREAFLKEWDRINLYSTTRGINRFKGLVLGLKYALEQGEELDDLTELENWTENEDSLSNQALEEAISKSDDEALKKALTWSLAVNKGIEEELAGNDQPFPYAKEAIEAIAEVANIAIVSSANREAIDSEWNRHGLMSSVDFVYGQERGSKEVAIADILDMGYDKDNVLMVGDAPGDEAAAVANGVLYYPILFGKEEECWKQLEGEALKDFLEGNYRQEWNQKMKDAFYQHLESASE